MTRLIDVAIDFETYYDSDYTLSKLMLPEYILDPRFEVIGCAISLGGGKAKWYSDDHAIMTQRIRKIPWDRCRAIIHNAMFDGAILEWVYGVRPAKYFCTMMGSRPYVAPYTGSMSLASVSKYLGATTEKGHTVATMSGRRRSSLTRLELKTYGEYCENDVNLCNEISVQLLKWMPPSEQDLIDLTVKNFTRPVLQLDDAAIKWRVDDLETKRTMVMFKAEALGGTEKTLRSRPLFVNLLKKLGVEAPTKTSKQTGKQTYALAKNDEDFVMLLQHPNPQVVALVQAKIFMGSNMERTRLERFARLYALNIRGQHRLPVPLLYYGAHTGRKAGLDKINLQNLNRVKRNATGAIVQGHLRFTLRAPDGWVVVAGDLSNIEARIVATLARCARLVKAYADKRDIYSEFATMVYGRLITKLNEIERLVGKTCILGLGFGMGWIKLQRTLAAAGMVMDNAAVQRIVTLYRDTYMEIPALWSKLESFLRQTMNSDCMESYGPLTFTHERVNLPNGMPIIYPGIRHDGAGEFVCNNRKRGSMIADKGPIHLWGGVITENIVQALARIVISDAELRLARMGLKAVLQVHDELVFCVPEQHVKICTRAIEKEMVRPVAWMPQLPLACEVKSGPTYGDAK